MYALCFSQTAGPFYAYVSICQGLISQSKFHINGRVKRTEKVINITYGVIDEGRAYYYCLIPWYGYPKNWIMNHSYEHEAQSKTCNQSFQKDLS
jgi:hypothetical protein